MTNEGPCVSKIGTKELAEAVFPGRLPREELRIMVRPGAHAAMLAHAKTSLEAEVCGVMLGVPKKDAQGPFLIVEDVIEGQLAQGSEAKVTFTPEAWEHIFKEQEKRDPDLKMVGWYHTHPRFGIFLSSYDLFIHQNFFGVEPWMVAFVIDPVQEEEGFFYWHKGSAKRAPRYWIGDQPRSSDGAEFDGRVFADDSRPPAAERSRAALAPVAAAALATAQGAPPIQPPQLWHQDPYTLGLLAVVLVVFLGYLGMSFLFPDRSMQRLDQDLQRLVLYQGALNRELRDLKAKMRIRASDDPALKLLDLEYMKTIEELERRANEANPLRGRPGTTPGRRPKTGVTPPKTGVTPPKTGVTPPSTGVTPPKTGVTPPKATSTAPEGGAAGPPRPSPTGGQ